MGSRCSTRSPSELHLCAPGRDSRGFSGIALERGRTGRLADDHPGTAQRRLGAHAAGPDMGDRGRRPVPRRGRVPAALGKSRRRAAGGSAAGDSGPAAVVDGATAGRMSVTVVVASRNRRADLLASLPRHEAPVILVDNGSTDGTVAAVRAAHPQVTVLPLERNEGAAGRTRGVVSAGTEFVAFADDDSWWAPGDLARAV